VLKFGSSPICGTTSTVRAGDHFEFDPEQSFRRIIGGPAAAIVHMAGVGLDHPSSNIAISGIYW
jgi:hypothetical protein